MFIQVIQGHVTDAAEMKASMDRWLAELAPGATGWLGSTAGVTADGTLVSVVRFESPEAAQANSHRPEQDQWWMETAKLFSGEVTFHDCSQCSEILGGGSDQAGFVQVIQGRVSDQQRASELMGQMDAAIREMRPDVIGGTLAVHDDGSGGFTQTMYFTSEAEARKGEAMTPPPEAMAAMEEMQRLTLEIHYFDLTEPWLVSR
jgi:hypothetical protein